MDEIRSDIAELRQDAREIKQTLHENTVELARYNAQLEIHILATNDLRARVQPIEDHVKFVRTAAVALVKVVGVLAGLAAITKLVLDHL